MPIRRRSDAAALVFFRIAVKSNLWISGSAEIRQSGSVHSRSQKIPVAVLGHPARTGEMTVVDTMSALTFPVGIEPEQDLHDLRPLRTLFGGVQETNVERDVRSIVVRQTRTLGRLIDERYAGPCAGPVLPMGLALVHGPPRSRISGTCSQRRAAFSSWLWKARAPRLKAGRFDGAAQSLLRRDQISE
jgi:hypothetical protein